MNMIQRTFNCEIPAQYKGSYDRKYKVSAWMAMGSNTVNLRMHDPKYGWQEDMIDIGVPAVIVEKLSDYASAGIRTMDDLVNHLFYVVKA